ncbi:AraC family transcriptional regulator [Balneolaceae bacterium YR4-1]|uniref:AraC family transcriptional regulator n=1 Tax=Halalkalibaculum roseum TaxID=2709311 RepID=A0A6M1SZ33_9BACT|nr:helix-turn-helix domain-containing protein [Halalkalibaculum roseum]NGP75837.1 AraC family transcriptional regulator [Halalkalibaculum roseum]
MNKANGNWVQNREEVKKLKAERALQVLAEDIASIRYVKDWADKIGCSQPILNDLIKIHFGLNAKQLLKEIRFIKICEIIESDPNATSYSVARSTGLHDEQGLFKFLKRHFNTTYSEIRYDVLLKHFQSLNSQKEVDNSIKKWLG